MQTTRQQRKEFVKNAKRQVKKGLMTNAEFLEIKKQMAELGKEQHERLQMQIKENDNSVIVDDSIDIDDELVEDDFTPEDL
tara:strand:- start:240 stop:482 length:243 start_codon:yes stop_codon:yes gene_type:complete